MREQVSRRGVLAGGLALAAVPALGSVAGVREPRAAGSFAPVRAGGRAGRGIGGGFSISLAQWSLHRAHKSGTLDPMDFPRHAKEAHAITAVEYVNSFYKDTVGVKGIMEALRKRCDDLGVKSLLIMCDGEGHLGAPDRAERTKAVGNHYKWLEAAAALGCHSIRVNAASEGSYEEQQKLAADGLRRLCEFGDAFALNVIVENHGGLSSNGAWLAGVMKLVDHPRVGTLPDFGNFCLDWSRSADPAAWYDRYAGVAELMPYAKGVSAKSHDFDEAGNETKTDYMKMLRIVLDAGYSGHIGIEYEGETIPEDEGIRKTKALLERVGAALTSPAADYNK